MSDTLNPSIEELKCRPEETAMDWEHDLNFLALKDPDLRREALEAILNREHFSFTRQKDEKTGNTGRQITNYLLDPWNKAPGLLFCAHYDAVSGSFGANDNAAALCILIALAKTLRAENFAAQFAFFDAEETKQKGSRLYVQQMDETKITGVINLDICGYGDTIAVYDHGNAKKPAVANFCSKDIFAAHGGTLVKYLPEGDDISFGRRRMPVISVAIVPKWDIQYLKALSGLGSGLLGRPPEFSMILEQMEISSTMHGGSRDTPEWVDPQAMQKVYQYLLDALHAPIPAKRRLLPF